MRSTEGDDAMCHPGAHATPFAGGPQAVLRGLTNFRTSVQRLARARFQRACRAFWSAMMKSDWAACGGAVFGSSTLSSSPMEHARQVRASDVRAVL